MMLWTDRRVYDGMSVFCFANVSLMRTHLIDERSSDCYLYGDLFE